MDVPNEEVGLGVDIVEIARMRKIIDRSPAFVEKVYSAAERAYCDSHAHPEVHYATRFAAKEALAKALGVKLELVPTTWPSLMKDLGDDRFDIAMGGVSISLDRQKKALFSLPYLRDGKTPITRCENTESIPACDRPSAASCVIS